MKRSIMILAIIFIILFGCKQAVIQAPVVDEGYAIQTTDGVRYVKNSDWDAVKLSALVAKASARAVGDTITGDELTKIVDKINEDETDTQFFIEETDLPVEEAPFCNVYIVNEVNPDDDEEDWGVLASYTDWPRQDVKDRREAWSMEAMVLGGILFVDKVPPKPIPIEDPRTPYEKYAIYMVDSRGLIVTIGTYRCEEHVNETWLLYEKDPFYGAQNIDQYFNQRVVAYTSDLTQPGDYKPWRVISGELYNEPVEDPEIPIE